MATLADVESAAATHGVKVRGIVRSGKQATVLMYIEHEGDSITYFSTGFLLSEQQAVDFAYGLMQETTEEIMNLLKNDKLFPNINGVMLKDKPVTLHLSGRVNVTELQGGDARVELFFSDHKKTAVINRNQVLNIIEVYGPETDAWKGKPVVLTAEEGVWFGKHQWGLRVDVKATERAHKADGRKPPHAQAVEDALKTVDAKHAAERDVEEALAKENAHALGVDAAEAAPLFDDEPNGAYQE